MLPRVNEIATEQTIGIGAARRLDQAVFQIIAVGPLAHRQQVAVAVVAQGVGIDGGVLVDAVGHIVIGLGRRRRPLVETRQPLIVDLIGGGVAEAPHRVRIAGAVGVRIHQGHMGQARKRAVRVIAVGDLAAVAQRRRGAPAVSRLD